jgi:IclR helix-turn-helix domain
VTSWGFLTTHARVLLCIAHDPGARLRDIAASLGITERRAHGIVTDLAQAGYLIRLKDGRRNRYQVQAHLLVSGPGTREPAVGEIVALFAAQGRLVTGPARASAADASGIRQAQNPLTLLPAGPSQPPGRSETIGSYSTGEVNG